jgi:UDPglucose--hexose-1-phosphate uridylyltransferase
MGLPSVFQKTPHRRRNILTGEWVLVSPQRVERPWQGSIEKSPVQGRPQYDPTCYLCPGNKRANGKRNPAYDHTFVFDNDFPALLPDSPDARQGDATSLLEASVVRGTSRVLCFSPRHDLRLSNMDITDIVRVVDAWAEQDAELGRTFQWVQIFENNGEMMGCSNPHPHGQLWASSSLPNEPTKEDIRQREYFESRKNPLLVAYGEMELKSGERVVVQNEHWTVLVPYWANWPYETLLLPKTAVRRFDELDAGRRQSLAAILQSILVKYDSLFSIEFPYSMGWHPAPHRGTAEQHWCLHAHFYPPLLRSATVKKFAVGYEMLSEPQRDLTAEQAAERLRNINV